MIYFDNAATSFYKPECVINSIAFTLRHLSANPGRGGHSLSISCGQIVNNTRKRVADFFGLENMENVIFTKNCTEALNLAILGSAKQGGHVITSANEHNSVLRPLFELERAKIIELTVLEPNCDGVVTCDMVENAIKENTYLVALNHVSNVTGATCDIEKIGGITAKHKLLFLVDTAQSAGHIFINMKKMNINMLAFAGHKGLYASQGIGGLCFTPEVQLKPIMFGGTGTASESVYQPSISPEAFESGTLNTPAIAGLNSALMFLSKTCELNFNKLQNVQNYMLNIMSTVPHIKIYSKQNNCGIISFEVKNLASSEVADILNTKYDIAVRGGLHCAPLVHKHMDTMQNGLVRVSLSPHNTTTECDKLINALMHIYEI